MNSYFLVIFALTLSQTIFPTLAQTESPCPPAPTIERGQYVGLTSAPNLTTRSGWGSRVWACSSTTCKVGTGCTCAPKSGCFCTSRCTGKLPACGPCTAKSNIWGFENTATITLHHTASPRQSTSYSQSVINMRSMQNQHMDVNGWCDIGYHFIIDSAGNTFQGRPFWDDTELVGRVTGQVTTPWNSGPGIIQGAHSGDRCNNHNNIGVSIMGCYDSNTAECPDGIDQINVGDATYNNLINILSYLCKQYAVSTNNIKLHKDFVATTCPGDKITSLLPQIKADVAFRIQ